MSLIINPLFAELKPSTTIQRNKEAKSKREAGETVYNFSFGESSFPTPDFIQDDYIKFGAENKYSRLEGIQVLKEEIAHYYQKEYDLDFKPDNVFIGPGSKEIIFHLLFILKTHFIVPVPLWLNIVPQLKLCQNNYTLVNTFGDNYKITPESLESVCSKDNSDKTLILISPNNPTGLSYSEEEIRELSEVCRKYNLTVISDEIYSLINFEEKYCNFSKHYPENTIITNGVSKAQSMGGYRIGYCLIPDNLLNLLHEPLLIMAGLTHSGASTPLQFSSVNLFKKKEEMTAYLSDCTYIYKRLANTVRQQLLSHNINCVKPDGAFYLYPNFLNFKEALKRKGISQDYELTDYLIEQYNIFTTPGSDYSSPSEELSLRLSMVDFDGEKALKCINDLKRGDKGIYFKLFESIDTGISELLSFTSTLDKGVTIMNTSVEQKTSVEHKLQWSYSAKDLDELRQKYDEWASEYDNLNNSDIGWIGPCNTVEYLEKYVRKEQLILDAGAGTGLVGEILQKEGYQNVVGVDLSEGMMREALKKNIYKQYHLMDLTKELSFNKESFDAVILAGVFTYGHVGPEIFTNIIPVVKKGGYIVFTIREDFYHSSKFEEKINILIKQDRLSLVEKSDIYQAFKNEKIFHHIEVYRTV
jgi:aspartate/methionine/tyrosine aminotransferase/SAM-dependent methyltransferase